MKKRVGGKLAKISYRMSLDSGRHYSPVQKQEAGTSKATMLQPAQIEIAASVIAAIWDVPDLTLLHALLNVAQNPPPHGGADGTIGAAAYNALRALHREAQSFSQALKSARLYAARDQGVFEHGAREPNE